MILESSAWIIPRGKPFHFCWCQKVFISTKKTRGNVLRWSNYNKKGKHETKWIYLNKNLITTQTKSGLISGYILEDYRYEELEVPKPGYGEILVKVNKLFGILSPIDLFFFVEVFLCIEGEDNWLFIALYPKVFINNVFLSVDLTTMGTFF